MNIKTVSCQNMTPEKFRARMAAYQEVIKPWIDIQANRLALKSDPIVMYDPNKQEFSFPDIEHDELDTTMNELLDTIFKSFFPEAEGAEP
jgi:hypothetical protein